MIRLAKRAALLVLNPALKVAARSYIAGTRLEDAQAVRQQIEGDGFATTIGPWDGPDDTPEQLCAEYNAALETIAQDSSDTYLSIKLPAINYDPVALDSLLTRASALGRRIHFDALAPETAERSWSTFQALDQWKDVGCTLPGRWERSVEDAKEAARLGWFVRVVKGQWSDPDQLDMEPRDGYMNVINALAGKARHVSVATHDVPLAQKAIEVLRSAETPCDLELLYGLPKRPSLALAKERDIPVRFYIPYGNAYVPYVLSKAVRDPKLMFWFLRDTVSGVFGRTG